MQWALAEPAAIDALVLVGATPRFVTAPDWPHAMDPATLARFGDELAVSYRLALQRFLSLQLQGGDDAGRRTLATLRATLFARGDPDRAALAAGLEILRATDLRDRVREIQQTTLVIAGERDALAPAAASRWLAGAMPAARLAVISGAGHVSFLSHPDAFVGALAEFEHAAA